MPDTIRRSVVFTRPRLEALPVEAERLRATVSELVRRIVDEWRAKRG